MIYTFDIEDYYKNFCKFQLNETIDFNNNFYRQTLEISKYLNKNKIKGVFYILGEVAEYFPNLVRQIHKDNHIIGIHGYDHKNIKNFTKENFKKDLKKSIDIIKSIDKNILINHYRSPGFSMLNNINEYYEVLNELKIYNSSSFTNTKFKKIKKNIQFFNVKELPLPSINLFFIDFNFTGGSYFRITPMILMSFLFKFYNKKNIIFYFHPYDFFYIEKLNPFKYSRKNKKNYIKKYLRNFFYNINTKNNLQKFYKILNLYK